MILDDRLELCDATTANGTGIDQIIGDVVDTRNFTKELGAGEPLYLVIQVETAYTAAGTSVEFELRTSTLAALTGGTTTKLLSTDAISTVAGIAVGTTLVFALPKGPAVYQQYLGLWIVTVGAVAGGKINAFFTKDATQWRAYSDNDPGAV